MENPYKPGDTVVFYGPPGLRAEPSRRFPKFGEQARVKWANSKSVCAVFLSSVLPSSHCVMPPNMFAPEKFEPGDRVRIVALCDNTSPRLLGAEATVSAVSITHSLISLTVPARNPGSYVAYPWELELIERAPVEPAAPALKFKVGDRVRYVGKDIDVLRGGFGTVKAYAPHTVHETRPWAVDFDEPFNAGHECAVKKVGLATPRRGWWCGDDDLELLKRKWKPARFETGLDPDLEKAGAEAVAEMTVEQMERLMWPTPHHRVSLAEPPPPRTRVSYVVSIVGADNMTLDFAANPKRHDRRAHAETEAARLSKLHPGKTFRVFRLEPLTDTTPEAPKPAATKVVRFEDKA